MIGRLQGTLLEKTPPNILLDVNGVGYEISLPMTSFYQLPDCGQHIFLHTHFIVRDDAHLLFGFTSSKERALFREVIKVNGVGPKLGLAILSAMTANQFVESVEREDVSTLVNIPGVGKKTAERLLIEMRDRLKTWSSHDLFSESTPTPIDGTEIRLDVVNDNNAKEEAMVALISLGYKNPHAEKAVKQVAKSGMRCEDIIRDALRSMG